MTTPEPSPFFTPRSTPASHPRVPLATSVRALPDLQCAARPDAEVVLILDCMDPT